MALFNLIRKSNLLTKHSLKNILKYKYACFTTDFDYEFGKYKEIEKIRNIGISGHFCAGKTNLTERILYYTGRIDEMHEVKGKDRIGAVMDSMDLERERGITIQSAANTLWKDHSINIIDTPGHVDFSMEVERALRVVDGAILVFCAFDRDQNQAISLNRQIKRCNVPCIAFINQLDRMNADPQDILLHLRNKLHHHAAFLQIPIGFEENMNGIIDVISQKALYFEGDFGETIREGEIPSKMIVESEMQLDVLINCLRQADREHFFEIRSPTKEDIYSAIRRTCLKRTFTPVLIGTTLKNKGVQPLLDAVLKYLPNPGEVKNYCLVENEGKEESQLLCPDRTDEHGFVGFAFKLESKKYGQLTYVRCYQGKLSIGNHIFNARTNKRDRVSRLVRMHSSEMVDVTEVFAGDIFCLFGVNCAIGDTFTSNLNIEQYMESMYIPEHVVSKTIVSSRA